MSSTVQNPLCRKPEAALVRVTGSEGKVSGGDRYGWVAMLVVIDGDMEILWNITRQKDTELEYEIHDWLCCSCCSPSRHWPSLYVPKAVPKCRIL